MASIQRIVSPLTKDVSYRAQVRVRGRPSESATFPNRKEAQAWAASIETAIREGRHFPHAAARRTSFDALAKDYVETILAKFDETQRDTRTKQVMWWAKQFAGLTVAEVTADVIAKARDAGAAETFAKGKPRRDKKTDGMIPPKQFKRTPATINRYVAALSHAMTFAVKERRLIDRNPVGDIRREKEPRGRTRFLSDAERTALLDACEKSEWAPLHALVLLEITTGARRGELISLRWTDVDMKAGRALVQETKNGDPRVLPLVSRALETLRSLRLQGGGKSEWVFPQPSGYPGPYENFDGVWYDALRASGIEDFRFHDLRHTTASYLAGQGASLLEIADTLGHKTLSMVKRYAHLTQSHKVSAIERMAKERGL